MIDPDYADDLALLAITLAESEISLHRPEQASGDIVLNVNTNKTIHII